MKKFLLLIIMFSCLTFIIYINYKGKDKDEMVIKSEENIKEEVRGVFISYIDYSYLLKGKSVAEQKNNIDKMISNIKDNDFNMIILQVRPFSDAIYNSQIYLSSRTVVENENDKLELDILDYFIKRSHEQDIKIHAWLNPYRIRSVESKDDIATENYYYKWFDTNNIEINKDGIYLNPASQEVLDYIISGVEELVLNYDIDGLLYDDYFYPSETIDLKNYEEYVKAGGTFTIEEYRKMNINTLIYETNSAIKKINKKVLFGISPAGNISNNLKDEYLDVEHILKGKDFIDYIMPQIYYGFENEAMPFISTIELWNSLITNDIDLYVALGLYKSGLEDAYAGSGKNEWLNNNDIIKKQIVISRLNSNYKGFVIFRYNHLFNDLETNQTLIQEVNNMKSIF